MGNYFNELCWLSHEDHDVVCLKAQNCAVGEIRTYNILVESPTLFQLSNYASSLILGICMWDVL